jgi:MOSC domain-containing protein YiiM
MARVEQIFIAEEVRGPVKELQDAYLEAGMGIRGDRYWQAAQAAIACGETAGINQVTLIDKARLDEFLAEHDSDLGYGEFRRSIITSGIELNDLVDKSFMVGDARLRGTELCEPCAWLKQNVHEAVLPDLVHKAGLRAIVESSASISPGAEVKVLD